MKVRKYQGTEEQTLLTALIVHDRILRQLYQEMGREREPFKSKWSNIIARWCFEYYEKHKKAPKRMIQDLFIRFAQKEPDDNAVQLVEKFLAGMSESYKGLAAEINESWVMDVAGKYFERVRLERMADNVQSALENKDLEAARRFRDEAKPVSFSPDGWLNPFSTATIQNAIERMEKEKPIVRFRGDLGRFLSPYFERDGFICFAAPEKKGKSFWLQEVVWTALNQRRKVLYYVLGDMSADQVYRRLYARMTMKPRKTSKDGVEVPIGLAPGKKDDQNRPTLDVTLETVHPEAFDIRDVKRSVKLLKMRTASKKNLLRLRCAGASTISASMIESDIDNLTEQDWVPDLVVVDYLDLLLSEPSTSRLDLRHQINDSWKIMRRISTEKHCLVVGATQAAARAYDGWLIQKRDFSEDKRKNAHVTGMLGINQTPAEKKKGVYRLNWIFLRDGIWSETQYVWTAGNLALGCPCMKSLL